MSDPLSIAASITGLIAVAGQLYITLDTFVSNVKDAPLLSRIILSEVKSFRNTLHALQQLLSNPNFYRSSRGALISADYVVVSFTDAVLLFSELEAIITPLSAYAPELGLAAKAQWVRKKQRLNELVGRLQWQKHTLVLQLNILKWYMLPYVFSGSCTRLTLCQRFGCRCRAKPAGPQQHDLRTPRQRPRHGAATGASGEPSPLAVNCIVPG